MKAGTIHILDLDFEFKLWKNRLYHYQSELEILNGRIFVLTREHPGFVLPDNHRKMLDEQLQNIRNSLNKIENMEQEMALYAEDYPINENHSHYTIHTEIRKEMKAISNFQFEIVCNIFPELCNPFAEMTRKEKSNM